MPDDQAQNQGQAPAPVAIDNRKANLLAGLDHLSRALSLIPAYVDHDQFLQIRETHWLPALRQLDALCHLSADLYPISDITQDPGYIDLRHLIEGIPCDQTFKIDLLLTSSNFVVYKAAFGSIPDVGVWPKFFQVINKLQTAATSFIAAVNERPYFGP